MAAADGLLGTHKREQRQQAKFAQAEHPCGATAIAWVEVSCEERKLDNWLGSHGLSIQMVGGPPGLRRIGLQTAQGSEVVFG
jgi:hypothetical protein